MSVPRPLPGLVIHYSYLWNSQARSGLTEGTKDRPCVIIAVGSEPSGDYRVSVLPITHATPQHAGDGVALPLPTKQRLGLDDQDSWVVVTELNRFSWPGFDLRSIPNRPAWDCVYGFLPPKLFHQIKTRLMASVRDQRLAVSRRDQSMS